VTRRAVAVALAGLLVAVAAVGGCTGERPEVTDATRLADSSTTTADQGSGQPVPTSGTPTVVPPDGAAPVVRPEIVATYPHDPAAFTQGLEMAGDGTLLEGTGLEGSSDVRRVDLATGEVLLDVDLPADVFGEGITVLGDRLFQLSWTEGIAFVRDSGTLEETARFAYLGEGWGLTNDGVSLIMSDGSSTLTFRDPDTFDAVRAVDVTDAGQPVTRLNELEYVDGLVYANVWQTDLVAVIDAASGRVVRWLDLAGLLTRDQENGADVLNGIAHRPDTGTLLVTGKLWPALFEIAVP
jgi:glutaminyl-peptide cyclotransferase